MEGKETVFEISFGGAWKRFHLLFFGSVNTSIPPNLGNLWVGLKRAV